MTRLDDGGSDKRCLEGRPSECMPSEYKAAEGPRSGRGRLSLLCTPMLSRIAVATGVLLITPAAHATNGYFAHGYGAISQGVAGVGIAWFQDALAPAANPAGLTAVGNRVDVGLTWFRPERSADIKGNAFGPDAGFDGDGKKNFFFPDIGYVRQLDDRTAVGIAIYGNGGLNTRYRDNPYARFGGSGTAGVNLEQLFVSPALAWKVNSRHTIGAALNLAWQRFSAQGIGVFDAFSIAPGSVSDRGTDTDTGLGLRLGWSGELAGGLTVGATWASKISGRFDRYRGLFADGGSFDIPENYGIGVAWRVTPTWTVGVDVQRILYGEVDAVGNGVDPLFAGSPLGASNGPGFGWRNATVFKIGLSHQLRPDLTLRGGFSHVNQVVRGSQTFFNILAPGVVQTHLTLGFTWATPIGGELTCFYAYAPGKTVSGQQSIPGGAPPAGLGGGNANVRLKETILGASWSWRL